MNWKALVERDPPRRSSAARDRLAGKFPDARGYPRGMRRGLALDGPDDAIATFCNWTPPRAPGAVFRSGEAAGQSGAYGEHGFVPAKMDGPGLAAVNAIQIRKV